MVPISDTMRAAHSNTNTDVCSNITVKARMPPCRRRDSIMLCVYHLFGELMQWELSYILKIDKLAKNDLNRHGRYGS